jgi:hypothetical protein
VITRGQKSSTSCSVQQRNDNSNHRFQYIIRQQIELHQQRHSIASHRIAFPQGKIKISNKRNAIWIVSAAITKTVDTSWCTTTGST